MDRRRTVRRTLPLAGVLIAAAPAAAVELHERLYIEHYPVAGRSAAELHAAMIRNGPMLDDGRRAAASTEAAFLARYELERTPAGCVLGRPRLLLDMRTLVPEWTDARRAPAALRVGWDAMQQALALHEEGHRRITRAAAHEMRRRIAELEPRRDCHALAAAVDSQVRRVTLKYTLRNRRFDARTDHGRAAGTVLRQPVEHRRGGYNRRPRTR